jgi:glycosyltransferase involved in cell wall biosynthesis
MVVHAYYPLTETRVQREAEALVAAGYEVDVLCLRGDGEPARQRYRDVEVHRLPVAVDKRSLARQFLSYLRFLGRATVALTRLHRRRSYASVQVHNLPDFLVFCAIVPKLRGVPVILDLHDLMPEFFSARVGSGHRMLGQAIVLQERLACRFADHVITVTEQWRRSLIERGVPDERCSVVMNVADERIFTRRGPRPPDGEFRIFYHGSVTSRYGLDLVIKAVDRVRDDVPGVRLTIRGSGDQRPELVGLRERLRLEGIVDLPDVPVPEVDLPDLIAAADVGIVAYRNDVFTDSILPTKLMEYAAVGLPCIAARTTAIEAYFDGMVQLFTPGDLDDLARCIRELAGSPERRDELARRSVEFNNRHQWTQVATEYVELVRGLGERSHAAPPSGLR